MHSLNNVTKANYICDLIKEYHKKQVSTMPTCQIFIICLLEVTVQQTLQSLAVTDFIPKSTVNIPKLHSNKVNNSSAIHKSIL